MKTVLTIIGDGILDLDTGEPGPIVGVITNIHGDETVGVETVRRLVDNPQINAGRIRVVSVNQEALFLKRRYIGSLDMNRIFDRNIMCNTSEQYELRRARYIIPYLLECDWAIDLHSTSSETDRPFVLGWPGSENLAMPITMTKVFGWKGHVNGTLVEYLTEYGVPTIALEAGQHGSPNAVNAAQTAVTELLRSHGLLAMGDAGSVASPITSAPFYIINKVSVGDAQRFKFSRKFQSFDALKPGELIAIDGQKMCEAPKMENLHILMPSSIPSIRSGQNADAYFIARSGGMPG